MSDPERAPPVGWLWERARDLGHEHAPSRCR